MKSKEFENEVKKILEKNGNFLDNIEYPKKQGLGDISLPCFNF